MIIGIGVLVATADRNDIDYQACRTLLETAGGPLVTTPMVIAEAAYMIDRQVGPTGEIALYTSILDGAIVVEPLAEVDWRRIRELVDRYSDLHLDGTDASVIAVAERLGITRVATLDQRHFRVVRPAHCDAFELVP